MAALGEIGRSVQGGSEPIRIALKGAYWATANHAKAAVEQNLVYTTASEPEADVRFQALQAVLVRRNTHLFPFKVFT